MSRIGEKSHQYVTFWQKELLLHRCAFGCQRQKATVKWAVLLDKKGGQGERMLQPEIEIRKIWQKAKQKPDDTITFEYAVYFIAHSGLVLQREPLPTFSTKQSSQRNGTVQSLWFRVWCAHAHYPYMRCEALGASDCSYIYDWGWGGGWEWFYPSFKSMKPNHNRANGVRCDLMGGCRKFILKSGQDFLRREKSLFKVLRLCNFVLQLSTETQIPSVVRFFFSPSFPTSLDFLVAIPASCFKSSFLANPK